MNERFQSDVTIPSKKPGNTHHACREKKIGDPTIARLLRSAREVVEEIAWEEGLVWHPKEILRRTSPMGLAERVLPDVGTPAGRACAEAVGRYIEAPLTEEEARRWLAGEIQRRLWTYVIGARSKIEAVRLVVTESKIEVQAERPDSTRRAVGPAPFSLRQFTFRCDSSL